MITNVVNLTSHTICDVLTGTTIPPSGRVARAKTQTVKVMEVNGIPIYKTVTGEVEGLPDPIEGTIYIVSSLCLNSVNGRTDVVSPGNVQRNEHGSKIGCVGFRMN